MARASIPAEDCKHRRLYRIHSRNLTLGVYDKTTNGFIGIREKFGDRFLFVEFHWDNGPPYGTVNPKEDLGIDLPEELSLNECLVPPSICWTCKNGVRFEVTEPSAHKGSWIHLTPTECTDIRPVSNPNFPLLNWLLEQEKTCLRSSTSEAVDEEFD